MIRVYQAWELFQRKKIWNPEGSSGMIPPKSSSSPPPPSNQDHELLHHETARLCIPSSPLHKLSLPAQLIRLLLVCDLLHHTEEYVTIWGCSAIIKLKILKNTATFTNIQFQVSCQLFTSPTRPIQLPFTNSHFHFWHCRSHLTFRYSWRLKRQMWWIFHF